MNQINRPAADEDRTSRPSVDKHEASPGGDEIDAPGQVPADPAAERRRGRIARLIGIGVVFVILAMVAVGVWTHAARSEAARNALRTRQDAVPTVRTLVVHTDDRPQVVDLPGTMQAFDSATLYARATGYIARRNVDIGSHVHAGDVLAIIAAPDLDQQLAQARAQLVQMQASLTQAVATRGLAKVTNQRTSRLVNEGWDSRQQGDQDRTNFASQTAGVGVAQANLAAQVAQVNRLVQLTGFERVIAPFDGVITARQVDVGTLVTADAATGTPLFAIAHTDTLRVQVYVPQEYFFGLKDGQDATISVPQLPGRVFHGRVARNAAALATDTRTLLAEVDVDNRDNALSAGLYGIVHLQEPRPNPVVSLPSQAVIFNKDGLSAAVVEDGKIAIRHLDVAEDDGAQVQVRAGLKDGDRVILSLPVDLVAGMKVKTS
jgi:RND family efflux transporter MFP subunit